MMNMFVAFTVCAMLVFAANANADVVKSTVVSQNGADSIMVNYQIAQWDDYRVDGATLVSAKIFYDFTVNLALQLTNSDENNAFAIDPNGYVSTKLEWMGTGNFAEYAGQSNDHVFDNFRLRPVTEATPVTDVLPVAIRRDGITYSSVGISEEWNIADIVAQSVEGNVFSGIFMVSGFTNIDPAIPILVTAGNASNISFNVWTEFTYETAPATTPEPASMAIFGFGIAAALPFARRFRKK